VLVCTARSVPYRMTAFVAEIEISHEDIVSDIDSPSNFLVSSGVAEWHITRSGGEELWIRFAFRASFGSSVTKTRTETQECDIHDLPKSKSLTSALVGFYWHSDALRDRWIASSLGRLPGSTSTPRTFLTRRSTSGYVTMIPRRHLVFLVHDPLSTC
jgi:hypothetical protein